MQIHGINSSHNSDMHQVTKCIHNHAEAKKAGGAAMSAGNVQSQEIGKSTEEAKEFSLSAWLRETAVSARRLWGKIWGGSNVTENGQDAVEHLQDGTQIQASVTDSEKEALTTMQEQVMIDNAQLHGTHAVVASMAVTPGQTLNSNPYFTTVEDMEVKQQTLWQRVKVRFQNITGFLTRHFSFSNKNSFQPGKQQKDDLRRRSRYRKDDLEIDCVITDESYLMDSYNKQGEYSKLTTQK